MDTNTLHSHARNVKDVIETVIAGKGEQIDLVLTALFAGGHVLLEDVPGTGKTMLAKTLARTLNIPCKRIQFTPDLLPADLIGLNFYNPKTGEFTFRKGALFTHILLADEINRATPKTQSSLLESMEEHQITVDGVTYPLPTPFFVIATQNPIETHGTFPLPEAQLDRFLMRLSLGYPKPEETVTVLDQFLRGDPLSQVSPVLSEDLFLTMQAAAQQTYLHPDILRYIVAVAVETRTHPLVSLGVSTRGALALAKASQSYAALQGRPFVTPGDVKLLAPHVLTHRILTRGGMHGSTGQSATVLSEVLAAVPVPTEDWGSLVR